MASVVFALAHVFQSLAMGSDAQRAFQIAPAEIFRLTASGLVEGVIFIAVGWPVAYAPVYILNNFLFKMRRRRLPAYILVGSLLGVMFLPVCAGVPAFVIHWPDNQTYPDACIEFAYPMTFAGMIGGYAFWRFARRSARNDELLVDQFS